MEVRFRIRRKPTVESESFSHHLLYCDDAARRINLYRNAPDVGIKPAGNGEMAGESAPIAKKRRGRPRKYKLIHIPVTVSPARSFSSCDSNTSSKRRPGRPRGGGKLQVLASLGGYAWDTAGTSFTPHVVHVAVGENIVERVASFSSKGPRAICILSAIGSVSSVVLHQPASNPPTVLRFQGMFEILRLSGSFICQMNRSQINKGHLTISLAEPDGRVFGGVVANSLIAASPIQMIVGSFIQKLSSAVKKKYTPGAEEEEEEICDSPSSRTST